MIVDDMDKMPRACYRPTAVPRSGSSPFAPYHRSSLRSSRCRASRDSWCHPARIARRGRSAARHAGGVLPPDGGTSLRFDPGWPTSMYNVLRILKTSRGTTLGHLTTERRVVITSRTHVCGMTCPCICMTEGTVEYLSSPGRLILRDYGKDRSCPSNSASGTCLDSSAIRTPWPNHGFNAGL